MVMSTKNFTKTFEITIDNSLRIVYDITVSIKSHHKQYVVKTFSKITIACFAKQKHAMAYQLKILQNFPKLLLTIRNECYII